MKTITSTELKQETKKIIDEVINNPYQQVVVETYGEPKVVVMSYHLWEKQKMRRRRMPWEEFERRFVKARGKIDSTALIRSWRDAR